MATALTAEVTPGGIIETERGLAGEISPGGTIAPAGDVVQRVLSGRPPEDLRPSPAPSTVWFAGATDPKLRMLRSIPLDVRREEDIVTVHNSELEEFGTGATLGEALIDFGKTIADLYFRLEEDAERLGPHLVEIRSRLRRYLAPGESQSSPL